MTTTTEDTDWLLDPGLVPDVAADPLAPLYEASARGELALPFCARCGIPLDLEQYVCDGCGSSESDWRVVEPTGVVHSATTMHRFEPGLVRTAEPYAILDVELSAGHRLIMTTLHPTARPPRIGDTVDVAFRQLGGVWIPAACTTETHSNRTSSAEPTARTTAPIETEAHS
ncbi:Zn-ribbon domain-containing OB-fold protein [Rhodococcus sp. JVH1]|uniref:Zn-ribbon domain-containing OB-fold protein n=1 Tax=Rhodococcus sp. JVH1 TaxID=745408 RepID=UPI000271FD4F|nr:OB-fold domain-containing protein [Rhodococcus sp. JVH1]EJJ02411.1 3-ketoacyl-CoA thiolase [Rhodococcus sp. JVH1]